jgi:hypothetical protein
MAKNGKPAAQKQAQQGVRARAGTITRSVLPIPHVLHVGLTTYSEVHAGLRVRSSVRQMA